MKDVHLFYATYHDKAYDDEYDHIEITLYFIYIHIIHCNDIIIIHHTIK